MTIITDFDVPGEWAPTAIVLITDERICAHCKRSYTIPNPHVMIKLERTSPGSPTTILTPRASFDHPDTPLLPREHQRVYSTVERCSGCFEAFAPGQFLLAFMIATAAKPKHKTKMDDILAGI